MQETYGVALVTTGSRSEAEAIAQILVAEYLAACVNLLPVTSVYRWEGAVHQDEEWQLIIKTQCDRFEALERRIRELHSYEVPEIILLPLVNGSTPYLNWIAEQTRSH